MSVNTTLSQKNNVKRNKLTKFSAIFAPPAVILETEDVEILKMLDKLKSDLEHARQNFNEATDETLIDCYIYEIHALNLKYNYYNGLCRERGLVGHNYSCLSSDD